MMVLTEPRTDRALLRRFVRRHDEDAFAALVHRHGPAVLRTCRRVLGESGEADDAFQATFLVLARKAESGPWHHSVRSWLTAAAHRVSLHMRADRHRRREVSVECLHHPGESDDWDRPAGDPLREVTRRELRRLLEAELDDLPEKYRAPLVLCYLEGKTNQEAARQLGWATGSISRRLARGRAMLRDRPRLRKLALAVGILGLLAFGLLLTQRLSVNTAGPGENTVGEVMHQFHGDPGIENMLLCLESQGPGAVDADQLRSAARRTATLVASIRNERPGRWQEYADTAREASQQLAMAAETRNGPEMLTAGRKLRAACSACHTSYRSW